MADKGKFETPTKEEIIRAYRATERELSKLQREFKAWQEAKIKSYENTKKSVLRNVDQLRKEKEDISTQLTVALGKAHLKEHEEHMTNLQTHVECQEVMQEDITKLQEQIRHLEQQIRRVDKEMVELGLKVTSENQHNMRVAKARKSLAILEDRLDVSRKRECQIASENKRLSDTINAILHERALFNKLWRQMVMKLGRDKKYLIDLVDKTKQNLEQGVELFQKTKALGEKRQRDTRYQIQEMQEIHRRVDTDKRDTTFVKVKGQTRKLADLEPREYARRKAFKESHEKKLEDHKDILEQILKFSQVTTIPQAIDRFQQQENVYYSYFNYMNELNYQVETLNGYINELYADIGNLREMNSVRQGKEERSIENLKLELELKRSITKEKLEERKSLDSRLEEIFRDLYDIFRLTKSDNTPLMFLLGDHSKITVFNVKRFLKILENRLNDIVAYVYYNERRGKKAVYPMLTVRHAHRAIEPPSNIEDIVLAQQCAECAEGEDVNRYDEEFVTPLTLPEIKAKIREKVVQPEMQYRLHSISECRLPRSRMLASKR